jgi:excisionase family DNA binding protein
MEATLLSPQSVARRLGLSVSRVVQLDREGRLPALRDSSGRRFYEPATVERYASERDEQRGAAAHAA